MAYLLNRKISKYTTNPFRAFMEKISELFKALLTLQLLGRL